MDRNTVPIVDTCSKRAITKQTFSYHHQNKQTKIDEAATAQKRRKSREAFGMNANNLWFFINLSRSSLHIFHFGAAFFFAVRL